MDWANIGRMLFTALCMFTFAIVVIIAYGRKSGSRYEEAARSIFDEEELNALKPSAAPPNGAKQ